MSIATRLDPVIPDLSGRQRAVLVMRSIAAGEEPDRELWRIDDDRERRTFNRYMGLFYVANCELEAVLQSIHFHLQRLEEQTTLELLREAASVLEQETGDQADPRHAKNWRKQKTVTVPEFLFGVANDVRDQLLADILARSKELRALENAWDEMAGEFGETILHAEVRAQADEVWALVHEQVKRLGGPRRLPEPDAAFSDAIHQRIDRAFQQLRLVEV